MNSVSVDMKDILEAENVGTFKEVTGWGIFILIEPENLDTTITLKDMGGPEPQRTADNTQRPFFRSTFQVRVRGGDYGVAMAKARQIERVFRAKGKFTVTAVDSGELDTKYKGIFSTSEIIPLELDEKKKTILVQTWKAPRNETT